MQAVKHDPSKFCHAAKVFKDEKAEDDIPNACEELTWDIPQADSEMTKKRKGQFSSSKNKKQKTKLDIKEVLQSFANDKCSSSFSNNANDDLEIVKIGEQTSTKLKQTEARSRFDSDCEDDDGNDRCKTNNSISFNSVKLSKKSNNLNLKEKEAPSKSSHARSQETACVLSDNKSPAWQFSELNQSDGESDRKIPEFRGLSMLESRPSKESVQDKFNKYTSPLKNEKGGNPNLLKFSPRAQKDVIIKKESPLKWEFTDSDDNCSKIVPEFTGLNMLSDSISDKCFKENILSPSTSSKESSNGKSASPSKVIKHLVIAEVGETNSSIVNNEKKKKKKNSDNETMRNYKNNSIVILETQSLVNSNVDDNRKDGNESASSAGTDEIIAQRKNKIKNSNLTPALPSKEGRCKNSLLTQSIDLSESSVSAPEFEDSIATLPVQQLQQSSIESDSYDSDFDSNDFELVAKKLAKKVESSQQKQKKKKDKSAPQSTIKSQTEVTVKEKSPLSQEEPLPSKQNQAIASSKQKREVVKTTETLSESSWLQKRLLNIVNSQPVVRKFILKLFNHNLNSNNFYLYFYFPFKKELIK